MGYAWIMPEVIYSKQLLEELLAHKRELLIGGIILALVSKLLYVNTNYSDILAHS